QAAAQTTRAEIDRVGRVRPSARSDATPQALEPYLEGLASDRRRPVLKLERLLVWLGPSGNPHVLPHPPAQVVRAAAPGRPSQAKPSGRPARRRPDGRSARSQRSEEHTSELQSRENLVCRLLLEKKKKRKTMM